MSESFKTPATGDGHTGEYHERREDTDEDRNRIAGRRAGRGCHPIGPWAAESERLGFDSLAVIDRLVYDNLEPLVALAAAAARTERVELLTTVLNVGYRRNPVLLAKQIASVDRLSGGRLTVGLALGGWPEDYAASDAPLSGRGATFDATLDTMRRVWAGDLCGRLGADARVAAGPRRRC